MQGEHATKLSPVRFRPKLAACVGVWGGTVTLNINVCFVDRDSKRASHIVTRHRKQGMAAEQA